MGHFFETDYTLFAYLHHGVPEFSKLACSDSCNYTLRRTWLTRCDTSDPSDMLTEIVILNHGRRYSGWMRFWGSCRWPPRMVELMENFLAVRQGSAAAVGDLDKTDRFYHPPDEAQPAA